MTDSIQDRISSTRDWYERNQRGYVAILDNRRTRPRPLLLPLIGLGTSQEPFRVDTEILSPVRRAKRQSEIVNLSDSDDDISPVERTTAVLAEVSSAFSPTAAPTFMESAFSSERRPVFRAGDRSTVYAAKCRRARRAQSTQYTKNSLSTTPSQTIDTLPPSSEARADMGLITVPNNSQVCLQSVSDDPGSLGATETSRKRVRDVQEAILSNSNTNLASTLLAKKRKFTRRQNLGYTRQKTTMDTFISRFKDIPGDGKDAAAGGSAATGVVSQTSLAIQHVNDSSVIPVAHVDLIGRIEHDYSSEASPRKRARKELKAAQSTASSTLLEYDKRIADS